MATNPFVPQAETSTSSGGSRWVTNPKHLPIFNSTDSSISAKSAAATSVASNNAAFFTAIALEGAATSITGADAWITIADLTGGGFLFSVISATHSGTFTPSVRITPDGTQYTISPSAVFAAQRRLVVGAATQGAPITSSAGTYNESHIILPNEYSDIGFQARVGGVNTRGVVGIPSEMAILTYGLPCLRFETSLKIEVKASLLSGVAIDRQCAAAYRLDM